MDEVTKYQQIAKEKGGFLLSKSIGQRKVQWQCNEGHIFWLTTYKVHRRGKWCEKCGSSKGERAVRKILKDLNIQFSQEYSLAVCPRRRYDFYFELGGKKYIVEFDGEQHFIYVRKYHKKKSKFIEGQIIDRIKTYYAWNSGITIIRIDYTQLNNIYDHIINGINSGALVYFSDRELYKYITDINITHEQFTLYC